MGNQYTFYLERGFLQPPAHISVTAAADKKGYPNYSTIQGAIATADYALRTQDPAVLAALFTDQSILSATPCPNPTPDEAPLPALGNILVGSRFPPLAIVPHSQRELPEGGGFHVALQSAEENVGTLGGTAVLVRNGSEWRIKSMTLRQLLV